MVGQAPILIWSCESRKPKTYRRGGFSPRTEFTPHFDAGMGGGNDIYHLFFSDKQEPAVKPQAKYRMDSHFRGNDKTRRGNERKNSGIFYRFNLFDVNRYTDTIERVLLSIKPLERSIHNVLQLKDSAKLRLGRRILQLIKEARREK